MAANDFYHPSAGQYHTRPDASQPDHHSGYSVSPVASPFDDHYSYSATHSSGALGGFPDHSLSNVNTAYDSTAHLTDQHNMGYPADRQQDIFGDQNAIPLQNQSKTPRVNPQRYNSDIEQFGDGVEKRKKKKKGWFKGKVPWVVYLLTTIQVGVFIGELVKNGTSFNISYPSIVRRNGASTSTMVR